MATITGLTAEAMQAIVDGTIASGAVNGSGHLILTKHDSTTIDAGNVKGATGATGATGAAGADGTTLSIDQIAAAHATAANWSNNSKKITSTADGTSAQDVSTVGQSMLKSGGTFTGAIVPAIFTLTFAATILVNAALGNYARVTLTASTGTFGAPSNPVDGQAMIVEITQDGTGTRTVAWNAAYSFSTNFPSPTLSTAANAIDMVAFIYNASKSKWICVGSALGAA